MYHHYLLPLLVGLVSYQLELWPSYVLAWYGYLSGAVLLVPYVLDRIFAWFENAAQPVAGLCYVNLAILTIAKGIEQPSFMFIGYGIALVLMAVLVVWADTIREGKIGGISYKSIFFAALLAIVGCLGALTEWNLAWARWAIPLATVPVCVAMLLNRGSVRYWGAGYCLLLAIVTGFQTPNDPQWLVVCLFSVLGIIAFWRGYFQPARPPEVEHFD